MKTKLFSRLLSICLCVALLIVAIPISNVSAISSNVTDAQNSDSVLTTNESATADGEAHILYEMTDLRTANEKHFKMSDGTIMAATYDSNVHFEQNGEWVDIDNSLTEQAQSGEQVAGIETNANSFKVRYSNRTASGRLYTLRIDDMQLKWSLPDANNVRVSYAEPDVELTGDEAFTNLTDTVSQATYVDVLDNIDLQYINIGQSIKENIIVKDKLDSYDVEFELEIKGAELQVNDDGSLSIIADDEVMFSMPAPYMYDSNGKVSYNVEYQVEVIKSNPSKTIYGLTVCADDEWINSDDTAFPVTIDPTMEYPTTDEDVTIIGISDTGVNTGVDGPIARIGIETNATYTALVHINSDAIQKYDNTTIVGAQVWLTARNDWSTDKSFTAHKITGEWNLNSTTVPAYSETPFDYFTIKNDGWYKTYIDVTGLFMDGDIDNGFVLTNPLWSDENTSCRIINRQLDGFDEDPRPTLVVVYRNQTGLESYWSATSQSIGNSAVGHIKDFNGHLVFEYSDAALSTQISQLGVTHYYNSNLANNEFDASIGENVDISMMYTAQYYGMYMGKGWKINLQQSLKAYDPDASLTAQTGRPLPHYVYTDADGTIHFLNLKYEEGELVFETDSNGNKIYTYVDEDGLCLTVKSNYYNVLVDKKGNKMTFDGNDKLKSIVDTNGNTVTLTYDETTGALTSIADEAGHSFTFTYVNGHLATLADAAGRVTYYYYSETYNGTVGQTGGYLRKIERPDGTHTEFTYDSTGKLTAVYDGITNDTLAYQYDSMNRITEVQYKYDSSDSDAEVMQVSYDASGTVYRTEGVISDYADDDIYTRYGFDNYGRTVSAYTWSGNEELSSVRQYNNENDPNGTTGGANKLKVADTSAGTSTNLLLNPSGETSLGWAPSGSGTAAAYSNVCKSGERGFELVGGGQNFMQQVYLEAGTYTLSGYVYINSTDGKAFLRATVGTTNYDTATATNTFTATFAWMRLSRTFTVSTAQWVEISMHVTGTGTGNFDCLQLERGGAEGMYNHVENGGFNANATHNVDALYQWTTVGGTSTALSASRDGITSPAVKLTNQLNGDCYLKYASDINFNKNSYILSAWAKASASPKGKFELQLTLIYGSGGSGNFTAEFCNSYSGWQRQSVIAMPAEGEVVVGFEAKLVYSDQCTAVIFDDVSIVSSSASCYTYDENGNIVSAVDSAQSKSTMEYSDNDLTKMVNPSGYDYEYTYDDNHNLLTATSEGGVVSTYSGYVDGIATSMTVSHADELQKMYSSLTLTTGHDYISSVTDSSGGVTYYTYNENKGTLASTTDPMGNITRYVYEDLTDRLTKVYVDVNQDGQHQITEPYTAYGYNMSGQITVMANARNTYYFNYNAYGVLTSIQVGSTTLVSYVYRSRTLLLAAEYGDGSYVTYDYDNLMRVTSQITGSSGSSSSTTISRKYNKEGYVSQYNDGSDTYYYDYDLLGRVTQTLSSNGSCDTVVGYDSSNRISGQTVCIPAASVMHYYDYTYTTDNRLSRVSVNGQGHYVTYDKLGRKHRVFLLNANSQGDTDGFDITYSYEDGDWTKENSTTSRVSRVDYMGGTYYTYGYDENGNITGISKNGTTISNFDYDAMGRLTCEYHADYQYVYSYDTAGNITNCFAIDIAADVGVDIPYTYGNSQWGDQLTAYNGTTISYDAKGNPLNWRNAGILEWSHDRRLTCFVLPTYDGAAIFEYNAEGQRTMKNSFGDKYTDYFYNGSQLVASGERVYNQSGEVTGYSNMLEFFYDEDGRPMAFCYDRTDYYTYLLNLQGDVIAILDSNYNVVVEYTYSAYGQVMSVTGSLASTIGQINPLRYRGYYYDVETGFYYLNSRYYDPVVGRFLNPDSLVASTGDGVNGLNMYAYCFNNPVNLSDSSGNWPDWVTDTWDSVCEGASNAWNNYIVPAALNLGDSIGAFIQSFEADVYTGFGLGGSVDVYGASVDAGAEYKNVFTFDREGVSAETITEIKLTANYMTFELGPHLTEYVYSDKQSTFTWFDDTGDITLAGAELFIMYGVGFEVRFDMEFFIDRMVEIYG